jgi:hypothetical protein
VINPKPLLLLNHFTIPVFLPTTGAASSAIAAMEKPPRKKSLLSNPFSLHNPLAQARRIFLWPSSLPLSLSVSLQSSHQHHSDIGIRDAAAFRSEEELSCQDAKRLFF